MAFDMFFLRVPLEKASAVVFSIWSLVGGCGCPISIQQVCKLTESWALIYVEPISASATDPMTFPMILQMVLMAPFFGGSSKLSLK